MPGRRQTLTSSDQGATAQPLGPLLTRAGLLTIGIVQRSLDDVVKGEQPSLLPAALEFGSRVSEDGRGEPVSLLRPRPHRPTRLLGFDRPPEETSSLGTARFGGDAGEPDQGEHHHLPVADLIEDPQRLSRPPFGVAPPPELEHAIDELA